ncbi:aromatic acid exporter family protein [Planococcaceae bacterium Storch 2/2-2]|nr:aromatic acid exporter family protein [Planococcaceae bacterium Storch 2/2-2]
MFRFPFRGGRILKTGIAVFLTAWICQFFGFPPAFAVITAIVTIDPTVTDSIKKAAIRFPASAIGAFYTVVFVAIFGHAPITYTLSAVLTILTCYRLNLHAGLLVATLTAVAMVDTVGSNAITAFFTRLGSTSIGLLVSIAVNILILPPQYTTNIETHMQHIRSQLGPFIRMAFEPLLKPDEWKTEKATKEMKLIQKEIDVTAGLLQLQERDVFHPFVAHHKEQITVHEKQLKSLQMIAHHLINIMEAPMRHAHWTTDEREWLVQCSYDLSEQLEPEHAFDPTLHERQKVELTRLFFNDQQRIGSRAELPSETIILYEMLALYDQVDQFYNPREITFS